MQAGTPQTTSGASSPVRIAAEAPGPSGWPALPRLRHVVVAGVVWLALSTGVLIRLGYGTRAEEVAWAIVVLVPAGVFGIHCAIVARRCVGQRRVFWQLMAAGMVVQVAALTWRAGAVVAGAGADVTDIVYAVLTSGSIILFAAGLVVRMRMTSASTWIVQFLDALGLAVVFTTLMALPIAAEVARATADAKANAGQPLVLALLTAGVVSLLFTPAPWENKRVELVLAVTTALALVQSWLELYGIVRSGSRFLPTVGITLAAAFWAGAVAPLLEDVGAEPLSIPREDYDSVAWPYMALAVLPFVALTAVLRGNPAVEAVAIGGLLAGLVVAVVRQVQVLRTQRLLLGLARSHTSEREQDAAIARSLLDVSRRLSISPDRVAAERAVLNALATATTAPMVRIVDPDGTVTGDVATKGSLGPEAAIALVQDARGEIKPGAPRHFHDPAADVEGVLVAALTTSGELGAVLCAEGRGWKPAPNEVDLVSGLAHQLGVAVERAALVGRLGRSERLYRRIIDAVPVGMVEMDPRGAVIRSNRAFDEMTGLTNRSIGGAMLPDLFMQIELDPPDARRRFEREGAIRCRARVVTVGGVERMFAVDAARLGPERDGGRDTVCFVHDETELTKLRRRIGRAAANVEEHRSTDHERQVAIMSALAADAVTGLDDAQTALGGLVHVPADTRGERVEVARAAVTTTLRTVRTLIDALESYT